MLRAVSTDPANVRFTGGTITGVTGVPLILDAGGLPMIGLSTGSVSAAGAISGITALPRAYAAAFCYFPANIVATVAAAGFRYCTFSTTTAGTVFLDTPPATGAWTAPASPTAVTDGKGAFTGDTTEEFGYTLSVPALNASSAIRVTSFSENTNSANAKTYRVRLSGNAGTIFLSTAGVSLVVWSHTAIIANQGSTGNQLSYQIGAATGASATTNVGTVATNAATTLVFSHQRATATDNTILYPPWVELAL